MLIGAGIGILATNIDCALGDLIFKNKGLRRNSLEDITPNTSDRPSFFTINTDMAARAQRLRAPEIYNHCDGNMQPYAPGSSQGLSHPLGLKLNLGVSIDVAVESAYLLNDYIGIGGRLHITTMPVISIANPSYRFKYNIYAHGLQNGLKEKFVNFVGLESNHVGMFDSSTGTYFPYSPTSRLCLGSKMLIGRRHTADYDIDAIADADVEGLHNAPAPVPANDRQYFKSPDEEGGLTR